MKRQIYYYILLFGLTFFVLEFLHYISPIDFGIYLTNRNELSSLLSLTILVVETIRSNRTVRTLNLVLFISALLGFSFMVMHWPFGRLIFFSTLFGIMLTIVVHRLKCKTDNFTFVLLTVPLVRVVCTWTAIYDFPGYGPLWIIEFIIMTLVLIFLIVKLLTERQARRRTIDKS